MPKGGSGQEDTGRGRKACGGKGAKGLASSRAARSVRVFVSYVLTLSHSHSHSHTAISIAPQWRGEVGVSSRRQVICAISMRIHWLYTRSVSHLDDPLQRQPNQSNELNATCKCRLSRREGGNVFLVFDSVELRLRPCPVSPPSFPSVCLRLRFGAHNRWLNLLHSVFI